MTGLLLQQNDDVLILEKRVDAGAQAVKGGVTLATHVAAGHGIKKYGQIIGYAEADIAKGDHVHSHNCTFRSHGGHGQFGADLDAALAAAPGDMDMNCGDVLSQGVSLHDKGEEILDLIIATASCQPSKSEALGLGDHEFPPWQIGAVM